MADPMSLGAYARRRGVSVEAVSKAVRSGRLCESLVMVDGKPKIADAELADVEWGGNTRPRVDMPAPPPKKKRTPPKKREAEQLAPAESIADEAVRAVTPEGVPDYITSRAWREAHAARREGALADMAELERDQQLDKLVPVEEARAYMIEKFTLVKTRLLGVPSRVAQQLPKLAKEVEPVVDKLIREVLEELADEGDGDAEEDGAE